MALNLQISQTLYKPYIESIPLFKGCSAEFIQQIVSTPLFWSDYNTWIFHTNFNLDFFPHIFSNMF